MKFSYTREVKSYVKASFKEVKNREGGKEKKRENVVLHEEVGLGKLAGK